MPKRDWSAAIDKLEAEDRCRVCGSVRDLQCAHTIGRSQQDIPIRDGSKTLRVQASSIVPLCAAHHRAFDARELDLLPYLDISEQIAAVDAAGGIEMARRRLCPSEYRV